MKKVLLLALVIAVLFGAFVFLEGLLGAEAFFLAAIALALFVTLGPYGEFFKMAYSMLAGLVIALIAIFFLAVSLPLPPDNMGYVAIVSSVSVFLVVLLSAVGLRLDGLLIGWAGLFAAVYPIYLSDPTALATAGVPAAVGAAVSLLVGLVLGLLVLKMAVSFAAREGGS
ncbi:MAG: hypothetical protein ACOX4Q_08855 [Syntrophomonadales bacterium]